MVLFQNREEAGLQLAKKLLRYRNNTNVIVLALPRGGVVIGHELARELHLPLDILVTRKIGHPWNPEYALCAVDAHGALLCDESERKLVSEEWLKDEIERQRKEAERRMSAYRGGNPLPDVKDKVVLIVDDGIATGLSMRLAVKSVKTQKPARVIVAVPVASPESLRELERDADEVMTLLPPEEFMGAVGAHYQDFEQVEDQTVVRLLRSLE